MIDLHTHTLFSDGELLPSELVRRAEAKGYKAIALTDHADLSNIDFIVPRIVKVCKSLNSFWKIRAIPGVEITHVPLQEIKRLVKLGRKLGARIVVVHGETVSEPVIPGTNKYAINAGCDILAHPGYITRGDAELARSKGVYLELTARKSHSHTNKHVYKMAKSAGSKLVLNTDAHNDGNLISDSQGRGILRGIGLSPADIEEVFKNSEYIVRNIG
ncbi:MAG: histidinol phosphate phosphatase domain-containing protein [Candidatus Omnitrophota bacterium]